MSQGSSRVPGCVTYFSARHVFQTELLCSCADAVEDLRQLEAALQRETGVSSSDPHIAALLERWRRLHDAARHKDARLSDNRKSFTQLKVDLHAIEQWLGEAERLQGAEQAPPTNLAHLEAAVTSHKVSVSTQQASPTNLAHLT